MAGNDLDFSDVSCGDCYSDNVELIEYDFAMRERYLEKLLSSQLKKKKMSIAKYISDKNFIDKKMPTKDMLN